MCFHCLKQCFRWGRAEGWGNAKVLVSVCDPSTSSEGGQIPSMQSASWGGTADLRSAKAGDRRSAIGNPNPAFLVLKIHVTPRMDVPSNSNFLQLTAGPGCPPPATPVPCPPGKGPPGGMCCQAGPPPQRAQAVALADIPRATIAIDGFAQEKVDSCNQVWGETRAVCTTCVVARIHLGRDNHVVVRRFVQHAARYSRRRQD